MNRRKISSAASLSQVMLPSKPRALPWALPVLAHILRSPRCSDSVYSLRYFCRVGEAPGRRTIDPQLPSLRAVSGTLSPSPGNRVRERHYIPRSYCWDTLPILAALSLVDQRALGGLALVNSVQIRIATSEGYLRTLQVSKWVLW